MINQEDFLAYCEKLKGFSCDFPFDQSTWAMRVGGKIFALANIDRWEFINLKCDPDRALELREKFQAIKPGYHMNKKHWNSVYLHDDLPHDVLFDLIQHSYQLVFSSLSKKQQKEIDDHG